MIVSLHLNHLELQSACSLDGLLPVLDRNLRFPAQYIKGTLNVSFGCSDGSYRKPYAKDPIEDRLREHDIVPGR